MYHWLTMDCKSVWHSVQSQTFNNWKDFLKGSLDFRTTTETPLFEDCAAFDDDLWHARTFLSAVYTSWYINNTCGALSQKHYTTFSHDIKQREIHIHTHSQMLTLYCTIMIFYSDIRVNSHFRSKIWPFHAYNCTASFWKWISVYKLDIQSIYRENNWTL